MTETSIRLPGPRDEVIERCEPTPEAAAKLNDHAHYLVRQGKLAAAVVALRRAVAIAPDHPILLSSLGSVLYDNGRYAEAEAVLRRSIALEGQYALSHAGLGSVLGATGRYEEARKSFQTALKVEPGYSDGRWNYSMVMLDGGYWSEAWPHYETRKPRGGPQLYPNLPYPEWDGEDLNGKTIFIQGEQGIGDRILFSRYLYWLKKKYPDCKIKFMITAVDLPDITNLLWGFSDYVDFVPNGIPPLEGCDYHAHLMSLPRMHGTTPDNVPDDPGLILKQALKSSIKVSIQARDPKMMKVGICWQGNPAMKRNHERSIPFELMLQLAEIPNVLLCGLQFGSTDIVDHGADQLVCDLIPQIKQLGFAGTAAAIMQLDLVITCCTATAHLAGVLGAPTWTLLCANPYWLWLRNRDDSVWYPGHTLMRQKTQGDWQPVIDEVKTSLTESARWHVENFGKTTQAA